MPTNKVIKGRCAECGRHVTIKARGLCAPCYLRPDVRAPFVGDSAFAHKGGIHVSAVLKDSARPGRRVNAKNPAPDGPGGAEEIELCGQG
mgnify:CR=1 FL=1